MSKIFQSIAKIGESAMESTSSHLKCSQQLKALYVSLENKEEFNHAFKVYISNFLVLDYKIRNPYLEKSLQFISNFCKDIEEFHNQSGNDDDSPLLTSIITYLTEVSSYQDSNKRYQACYFLSKIFLCLTGLDLNIELCEMVQDAMLDALNDTISGIRLNAALALCPLQDPMNLHCPVISAFIELQDSDPNAKIRKLIVEQVALRKDIIPYLVERTRDVDANVRLAVYKRALKYPSQFKIAQKQALLLNGCTDENQIVPLFVRESLIPSWLQFYNNNYLDLLSRVRLDADWQHLKKTMIVANHLLKALCSQQPKDELLKVINTDEKKLIKTEALNSDSALYWRILAEIMASADNTDFDDYYPEIVDLCSYIRSYCTLVENGSNLEFQYILLQMLSITKLYDFSDIVCRRYLQELITDVLKHLHLDELVLETIMQNLRLAIPNQEDLAKFICSLASEIMCCPCVEQEECRQEEVEEDLPEGNFQMAQMKVKYHEICEALDEAVRKEDFDTAKELKQKSIEIELEISKWNAKPSQVSDVVEQNGIRIEDADPKIALNSLNIMHAMLKQLSLTLNMEYYPSVRSFKQLVIEEAIQHKNLAVKTAALKCLGLCCLLDEHSARVHIGIFCKILKAHNKIAGSCDPHLVIAAISTTCDLINFFGPHLLAAPGSEENDAASATLNEEAQEILFGGCTLSEVVKELLELMNDEDVRIQEYATRGLCTFILVPRVHSRAVVSRLLLKYVCPASSEEESQRIVQRIGVTLQQLPCLKESADQLLKAIVPTINIIVKAPKRSPLAMVDVDNTAKLMITLCLKYKEAQQMQVQLAKILLQEISEKPKNISNIIFAKMLPLLKIDKADRELSECLIEKCEVIRDRITDKRLANLIIKFQAEIASHQTGLSNEEPMEQI